ncbi:MAG TPA: tRNA pseudouridine(38-40) synthase TruA [Ectothiorhodospiraceae bacterium]|nr:tRNA pseudouridine(38-40) synthase TruA [Ectothiorhodospiraceae bacterium]
MRIAMAVEYDGSRYSGWQLQKETSKTIQAVVEAAISKVANEPIRIHVAGRTDTGVHATGQIIHFDTQAERIERSWVFGSNANLPEDVVVLWAQPVSDEFHARFSAVRRSYRFVIYSRNVRPTFLANRVTWTHKHLDIVPMIEASKYLLGEHDFSSFRAVGCQANSPVRTITRLDISQTGPYIYIDIEANAFLYHMVRNLAGVLMTIGAGEAKPEWCREVLNFRDRTQGGVTAPAAGLYLVGVEYPQEFGLTQSYPSLSVW